MKIALIYDKVNKFGGAERVLLSLHQVWPNAPLYTAVYDKKKAKWADAFEVKTSFLDRLPFSSSKHELFPVLTAYAFESFNFDKFDVVISVSSADAKSIITKPQTLHICYCLTPTRYLWSGYDDYLKEPGMGTFNPVARFVMKVTSPSFRRWDYIASQRPDKYIAISKAVANRIKKYYGKESEIIFPPVKTDIFRIEKKIKDKGDYFLIVSRLVPYKGIDYAIRVFNQLGWKLKIIGDGIDEKRLKNIAGKNIDFISSNLTDEKLCCYYQKSIALIFPGEEDFGLTSVEAQACGKPVVGLNAGGLAETVIPGLTGELYDHKDERNLISALSRFSQKKYLPSYCRENALRFSQSVFKENIKKKVYQWWKEKISRM
ncbi:glycosyltransferase [Patescibacteria group bacterium]|nr:glycosyltransferase [Patescibacteria group bacterium]